MSNIKLIRLLSGEELIAEVVSDTRFLLDSTHEVEVAPDNKGPIIVKNPHIIVAQHGENGQIKIGMAPWVIYKDKDAIITIRENAIVFVAEADPKLVSQLSRLTSPIDTSLAPSVHGGSSLILPSKY